MVEDDHAVRNPLEKFLRLKGFDVVTADTADAAKEAIARRVPDAAVVDLRLPQGSGRDVVIALPPPTPIVIFSAVPDESMRLEQMRPNTVLVLKPFSLVMLVETLRKMIESVQEEAQAAERGLAGSDGTVKESSAPAPRGRVRRRGLPSYSGRRESD